MKKQKKSKILVICHDAGGAEIISAYVKANFRKYHFICFAAGPAERIFKRKKVPFRMISEKTNLESIFRVYPDARVVIAGLSWSSPIELNFIRLAKSNDVKTVVYLDHWTNYRERFGYPNRQWKKNLPNEIWVGDKYAKGLAHKYFEGLLKIKLVSNLYFKEIEREYKLLVSKRKTVVHGSVLFISEPMSAPINIFGDLDRLVYNEYDILSWILSVLTKNNTVKKLIVRFHPSEDDGKYDNIISKYKRLIPIVKLKKSGLLSDLAHVDVVIGMGSIALVVAYLCGKKVFSIMPNVRLKCTLPFVEIMLLRSFGAMERAFKSISWQK